ncbi:MAG: hypothetical protein ACM3XM_01160 [Mycobacterium leprae]
MVNAFEPLHSRMAIDLYRALEPKQARAAAVASIAASLLGNQTLSRAVAAPANVPEAIRGTSGQIYAKGVTVRPGAPASTTPVPPQAQPYRHTDQPSPGSLLDAWF